MSGVSCHCEHFFLVKTEYIFFHSISYLVAIFVPETYTKKVVFDKEITTQNQLKFLALRFLGMPIAMVVVRSMSDQQFVR